MALNIVERILPRLGTAVSPPGDGPFPVVIVLHGSEGAWSGYSYKNATMLAAHGFLALPFGYSKGGSLWASGDIVDVALDRTADALAELRRHPAVGGGVGLYGASRGAEHALLLAALMARDGMPGQADAVAALSPPDVAVGGWRGASSRDKGDVGWQGWDMGLRTWTWRGSHDGFVPTTPIEVERYAGPILLAQGTEDEVWSSEMTRRLEARLRAGGRHPEVHWYEGGGHGVWGDSFNLHWEQVIAFFRRQLASDRRPGPSAGTP